MTTPFDERLSAFVDDELSEFEARRMAKELAESPELRQKWTRYQLIGSVMRDEDLSSLDPAFAEAIAAKIAVERPALRQADEQAGAQRDVNGWLKPVVGVAIAASVAAAAILVVGRMVAPVDGTMTPASPIALEKTDFNQQQTQAKQIAGADRPVSGAGLNASGIPSAVVTPVSTPLGKNDAGVSAAQNQAFNELLEDPLFSSFLATHAEYAAHTGILPRVRAVGFDLPVE